MNQAAVKPAVIFKAFPGCCLKSYTVSKTTRRNVCSGRNCIMCGTVWQIILEGYCNW